MRIRIARALRRRRGSRRVASSPSSSGIRMSIRTTVGLEARGLVDRLEAVARLGDDLDVRLVGQQHAEAGADHRLVVGDEDADASSPVAVEREARAEEEAAAVRRARRSSRRRRS